MADVDRSFLLCFLEDINGTYDDVAEGYPFVHLDDDVLTVKFEWAKRGARPQWLLENTVKASWRLVPVD